MILPILVTALLVGLAAFVAGFFVAPIIAKQKIEKQILESKEAQDLLQKEELKPLEKSVKGTLKGLLGN